MITPEKDESSSAERSRLGEMFDQKQFDEIARLLDKRAQQSKLELWQLVLKSRAIQLGESPDIPLEAAGLALDEALERESDYLPALLDRGHYLDAIEGRADDAIETFRKATDIVLEHLLDALRGWAEAKLMLDEPRKELLRSYNQFLDTLHSHGLEAGVPAKKIGWYGESEDL